MRIMHTIGPPSLAVQLAVSFGGFTCLSQLAVVFNINWRLSPKLLKSLSQPSYSSLERPRTSGAVAGDSLRGCSPSTATDLRRHLLACALFSTQALYLLVRGCSSNPARHLLCDRQPGTASLDPPLC